MNLNEFVNDLNSTNKVNETHEKGGERKLLPPAPSAITITFPYLPARKVIVEDEESGFVMRSYLDPSGHLGGVEDY